MTEQTVTLSNGKNIPAVSEYSSDQWWFKELENIFNLPISETVTADMKRAANVAMNLMLAIEVERK